MDIHLHRDGDRAFGSDEAQAAGLETLRQGGGIDGKLSGAGADAGGGADGEPRGVADNLPGGRRIVGENGKGEIATTGGLDGLGLHGTLVAYSDGGNREVLDRAGQDAVPGDRIDPPVIGSAGVRLSLTVSPMIKDTSGVAGARPAESVER